MSQTLKVLTFNIQGGVHTKRYGDYITNSWRHFIPNRASRNNINLIADTIKNYDLVGIQETDVGSLRNRNVNQVEHLAKVAEYPHWISAIHRDIAPLARYSMALLSRLPIQEADKHTLPSMIPGRAALACKIGHKPNNLLVVVTHLALSKRRQQQQLNYLSALAEGFKNVIIMGDMNCNAQTLLNHRLVTHNGLQLASENLHSFPSWGPKQGLDHILVSKGLQIKNCQVLDAALSDHLPVAIEIALPDDIEFITNKA